ncbi:hypothetical protein HHK36_002842 [Tetracentron sinense]|uniref:Uncharacterized protein n=1 Tax=Tetracentron sinense TaxID=13715 RepID=A0A834ZMY5_TETSI|nr:hypothetical protein HHK36_002842 [Tetracentron sinense]
MLMSSRNRLRLLLTTSTADILFDVSSFPSSMSKMKTLSCRKPPLPKSPDRLRPRRILRSNTISIQTPQASLKNTQVPNRSWGLEESQLRPEHQSISCDFRTLSKMVEDEFGNPDLGSTDFPNTFTANSGPLFERGRFYDEYSSRRNERLKRKKGVTGDERRTTCNNLGVTVESGKKKNSKKCESVRKSVPANFSACRTENSRYLLRSSKENKKPALSMNFERSVVDGDRKIGARRVGKS